MNITNQTRNTLIADDARKADSFYARLKGLLGTESLPQGQALIITRCTSIHMFFMKYPIDVIFVDKNNVVVGLVKNIKPFALSPIFWRASYSIEIPSGTIDQTQTQKGDLLLLQ